MSQAQPEGWRGGSQKCESHDRRRLELAETDESTHLRDQQIRISEMVIGQTFQTEGNTFSGTFYMFVNVTDATGWSNGTARPVQDTGFGGSYDHNYCQ